MVGQEGDSVAQDLSQQPAVQMPELSSSHTFHGITTDRAKEQELLRALEGQLEGGGEDPSKQILLQMSQRLRPSNRLHTSSLRVPQEEKRVAPRGKAPVIG